MDRIQRIRKALAQNLFDGQFFIEDESHLHAHGSEHSHLKILVISESFKGLSRVLRQRQVQTICADELSSGLHALSLRCQTPQEYSEDKSEFISPRCMNHQDK